jgi:cytoskeletal protein CcmA (bactofilin family)
MPITGSGDITIYVTGQIDVHKNITGRNVTIYSKGDIDKIEGDSTISGTNYVKLFSQMETSQLTGI